MLDEQKDSSETFFEIGVKGLFKKKVISKYFIHIFLASTNNQNQSQTQSKPAATNIVDVPIPEEFVFDEDEQKKGTR